MKTYALSQLSDPALLHELAAVVARDRTTTAEMLALISEVDARKLYLPAAFPSMFAYCVGELHLSEDAAAKRIQAARVARRFPVIFAALASGRLHLTAVGMLAPYLTEQTSEQLLEAATHCTKAGIEHLLAERFPRPELPALVQGLAASFSEQHALAHVDAHSPCCLQHAPAHVHGHDSPREQGVRSSVKPLAPQTFAMQVTLHQSTHDKLRYAQELLSHQVPSGDLALLLDRVLDAAIPRLEQRKFAATARPRTGGRRASQTARHVPAHVRRAVWERDQGRCTFVSEGGRRCPSRTRIEFDHVHEVARGGEATVAGMRLRCRAHNQYGAECTFGAEFMRHKRIAAAEARTEATVRATAARARSIAEAKVRAEAEARDVVPWLRQLGFSAEEARRGAARCEHIPDASLEARVRVALAGFLVRGTKVAPAVRVRAPAAPACAALADDGR